MQIENDKIQVIKNWPEYKLVQKVQVFIRFANFYQYFL